MSEPRPHPPKDLEPLDFFEQKQAEPFYEGWVIGAIVVVIVGWLIYAIAKEWLR